MLRTVHLHGRLGEKFGKTYQLDVASPAEAVRALMYQLPLFEGYIRNREYVVTAGRSPDPAECPSLSEAQLQIQLGKSRDIHIVPAPLMAGVETIIIVGLTLVLVAVSVAFMFMMKAPKPQDREEASKRSSFAFDGPENSIEQGHCVPLVYGEVRAGSVVASAGITTADIGGDPDHLPGGKSGFLDHVTDPNGGGGAGLVGVTPGADHTEVSDPEDRNQHGNIKLEGGGGGKGGGGGDGMQEAPNSLQSNATARILEIVSEGECWGLVNGLKSVYLDGTPLQNADDTFNFQGATVQQRIGLPDQDYIPGFAQAENSIAVDTRVSILVGPITRTINNPDVSVARVTIRVPSLYKQETDDGDINPTEVDLTISVQADGGGFTDAYQMHISGKTNQGYERSVDIHLPAGAVRDVRVTRITADSDVASLVNETHWSVLSEVIEAKLSYPDTALIGLTVDARQFGTNIPTRSYQWRGLIVEVPTNYDPVTREYAGVWDGTFKRAWTDNPAWCLRDLIVARRYGLGARIAVESVDKWVLYSIAQYCDAAGERVRTTYEASGNDLALYAYGNATTVQNVALAPDGTMTADRLVSGVADNIQGVLAGPGGLGSGRFLRSVYAKADGYNFVWIGAYDGISAYRINAVFDLATGTVASNAGNGEAGIESVGDGWYRCWAWGDFAPGSNAGATASWPVWMADTAAHGGAGFAGDGVSGVYLWGRQIEKDVTRPSDLLIAPGAVPYSSGVGYDAQGSSGVPDGFGGFEPRYTLNVQIKNKMSAYDLVAAMASNFRGWVYWGSGTIVTAMDRPEDPSVLVTRSNTVDGAISYGRITPHEKRRSVAVVYWNDPADQGRLTPEIVEDSDLIRRFGRRPGEEITGFGVSRKGHAHRLARFILEDESPASNVSAAYEVGDDHSFVAPGRVAVLADPMFTQSRRGGRVKAAAANSVTIDDPYVFVGGQAYSLKVMLPDGTVSTRPITNAPGSAALVTLGGAAWGTPPNPGAVWTVETDLVANRQFRVRSIETDQPPYRIKAVAHDPTKYARVEQSRDLETPNFLDLPSGPLAAPTEIGVFEYLAAEGTASVPCALFGWTPPADPRVLYFQAQAKAPVGDWFPLGDSLEPSRTVRNVQLGDWRFRVRSVDPFGQVTAWQEGTATLDGQTDSIPEVVAPGITIDPDLLAATLIWDEPDDTRPLRYQILYSAGGPIGTAVSLGVTDQLSWPITMQGNYWVQTIFLGHVSPAPTLVNASALIFSAGIVPHLTSETVALPALADGTVTSYAAATGEFKIYSGSTDISAAFALSTPAGGDPQALTEAYVGRVYSVTAGFDAGEEIATLRIRATGSGDWAGVVLDKDFTLTKAKQGAAGRYRDIKFRRSLSQPATPIDPEPAGWADGVPAGTDTLWGSTADKNFDGTLLGLWSTPQPLSALTPRGDYSGTATYYLNNSVQYNGGSYVAVQDNFTGHAPSGTGSATAYWDVLSAPGGAGEPGTPPSAFSGTIDVPSGAAVNLRDLANAQGYTGLSDATVTFEVESGIIARGLSGAGKGIDTGSWPTGSYTITLALLIKTGGLVDGGGGIGGNGADSHATGGTPGGSGGDAIYCRVPISITVQVGASVRAGGGGGGGGGGTSKLQGPPGEQELVTTGGGGGGGGFPNGSGGGGGVGSTHTGNIGSAGTTGGGGAGGAATFNSGAGGAGGGAATAGSLGTDPAAPTGGSSGGRTSVGPAGFAIRKNGNTVPVTNSGTITGTAA